MSRATIERIELKMEELEALLSRAKAALEPKDYETLHQLVDAYVYVTDKITDERTTIRWLRQLLGSESEKTAKVLGRVGLEENGAEKSRSAQESSLDEKSKRRPKGHGRCGADAYRSAERIEVSHESLKHGDRCPGCRKGKVYQRKKRALIVRIVGEAPLQAKLYALENLRCNACGELFTAKPPAGVGEEKYDASAAAMIALLKYGSGFPFYRLEQLQGSLGIPLPASTQWEIVRDAAGELEPLYQALLHEAAQGEILHNDDTGMTVLELMKAGSREDTSDGISPDRTGVFTSGIVSTREGRRVALFFTGRRHAGENLEELLKERAAELSAPIQMCDALSRNLPKELESIVANCLAHGRRQFVGVVENFPQECRHVLETLKEVYKTDATARERELSAEERLRLHQEESAPRMEELQRWLTEQIEQSKTEPNSGLGKAITYMLKRWERLTLFLREPGVPLDNNVCERALKKAILHRKNALFFRTEKGAEVGDLFMSVIHTCQLSEVDPFDYLKQILKHARLLAKTPRDWLPWNYRNTLARSGGP